MSEEELVTIELNGLTNAELEMVNVVIHEGELRERERIIALLNDDEVMHNIWWRIKREENYPSQEFIAEVIRDELVLINGEN